MTADITDLSLARAIEVWTRKHSGAPWTAGDEERLQVWLNEAPQHRAAYERVSRAWQAAGALEGQVRRTPLPPRRRLLSQPAAVACAALLVVAILLPAGLTGYRAWPGAAQHWTTHAGERRTLTLEDGTGVVLDASSELTVQVDAHQRHVWLKRGEALFSVRHDPARPFQVDAAGSQIRDLGTRFDVEIVRDTAHVSVLQGQVEVATPRGRVTLTAGFTGGYHQSGALLPVRVVRASTQPGPQQHFDGEPLADVLERFARYHGVTFVYTASSLQELRVSGSFNIDDLPDFLRTLSVALPLQTRFLAPQRIEISPRVPAAAPAPQPGAKP